MAVKAKFSVRSIEQFEGSKTVKMNPVYGNGEANKEWSQYTPSGSLEMNITNPAAFEQFEVGKEYYLTFEKAD